MTKLLSAFPALAMLCGIAVMPASAVEGGSHYINVTCADSGALACANTSPIALHTFGAQDVEEAEVNGREYTGFFKTIEDTVKGGSMKFRIYPRTEKNGLPILYFGFLNALKDTIAITRRTKHFEGISC